MMFCQAYRAQYSRRYISDIPTNSFGPGDNFYPDKSHVPAPINVGRCGDFTIAEFAAMTAKTVGFAGIIVFDPTRPDSMPRKVLNVGTLTALSGRAQIQLVAGLADT